MQSISGNGILSVAFSLLLFFRVGIGGLTLVYMIAFWAIVVGALRILAAFRLKRLATATAG